jgi:hypothetical protein
MPSCPQLPWARSGGHLCLGGFWGVCSWKLGGKGYTGSLDHTRGCTTLIGNVGRHSSDPWDWGGKDTEGERLRTLTSCRAWPHPAEAVQLSLDPHSHPRRSPSANSGDWGTCRYLLTWLLLNRAEETGNNLTLLSLLTPSPADPDWVLYSSATGSCIPAATDSDSLPTSSMTDTCPSQPLGERRWSHPATQGRLAHAGQARGHCPE